MDHAKQVLLIANPAAGAADRKAALGRLVDRLGDAGLEPRVALTERAGHASELAAGAGPETRCVVACGGDGTLGEVLNGRPSVPVALLPLGNENLFARELGYRRADADQAAEAICEGAVTPFDLGEAGGKVFCIIAGVGLDAMTVDLVSSARTGHINKAFYVGPTLQAVREYSYEALRVEFSDGRPDLVGGFVFIFNVAQYGGGLRICPEADGRDGLLDVCVFTGRHPRDVFRYMASVAVGRHEGLRDFVHTRAREVRVTASDAVRYQLDGDPGGVLPQTFTCLEHAARFVTPKRPPSD